MTTYLLPCYSDDYCWIEKVRARSYPDAQQKFIDSFIEEFDNIDIPSDWEDLVEILRAQAGTVVGDIYDIEEF